MLLRPILLNYVDLVPIGNSLLAMKLCSLPSIRLERSYIIHRYAAESASKAPLKLINAAAIGYDNSGIAELRFIARDVRSASANLHRRRIVSVFTDGFPSLAERGNDSDGFPSCQVIHRLSTRLSARDGFPSVSASVV